MQAHYEESAKDKKKVVIEVKNLKKWFPVRRSLLETLRRKKFYVKAVDGIEFTIFKEEIFGLIGESGCGKTTVARLLAGTIDPTGGEIFFEGQDVSSVEDRIQKIQMIFQEPYEYLSPWSTVEECLLEPLRINKIFKDEKEESSRMKEIMKTTGLDPIDSFLPKYPFELSGGERQRVMIARALMLNPEFIIADEPVSMLDASIRAGILNVILNLRERYHTSLLYVTHDITIAKYMCDRIAVMYLGKIMEMASADDLVQHPHHPYTKALIAAVPEIKIRKKRRVIPIKGEVQTARSLPTGCRFHPRCPHARDLCRKEESELTEVVKNHFVRCHHTD